jgi:ABC-type phosphate transport system permease subunit
LLHLQLVLSSFVIVLALLIIFLCLVIFSLPSLPVAGASVSLFLLFWDIGCDGPRHDLLEQSQHPTFAVIAFLLISSLIIYFDLIIELPLNIRYVFLFI